MSAASVWAGAVFLAAGLVLGGCIGGGGRERTPGELRVTAAWRGAEHLDVSVKNVGGSPMPLGGSDGMRLTAPNGTALPIHWSGMAPTLSPGETRTFELHAMQMPDGTRGLAMDHAMAGNHMSMPEGEYTFRMGSAAARATVTG